MFMKKISIILATFLAFTFTACNNGNSPEKVVSNFYKYSQEDNLEEAMKYSNIPENEQPIIIQYIENMGMVIHNYEVLGSTIDDGDTTATVNLHLEASNAFNPDTLKSDIDVVCLKINGDWKMKF